MIVSVAVAILVVVVLGCAVLIAIPLWTALVEGGQ